MKVLLLTKTLSNDFTFTRLYKEPLAAKVPNLNTCVQAQVYYPTGVKKISAQDKKDWLNHYSDTFNQFDFVLCSDGDYFKTLTNTSKTEGSIGVIMKSPYTTANVMYIPSAQMCTYHPDKHLDKLDLVFKSISKHSQGTYTPAGTNIVHSSVHACTIPDIQKALTDLHQYPKLAWDIEARALRFTEAGIYTIAFAPDKHNYICLAIDALPTEQERTQARELLLEFFRTYKGTYIVHKANYDVTVVNYTLFQNEQIENIQAQVDGLNSLFGQDNLKLDDTLVITYLATNSCAGNTLRLKDLAAEYAGNWAVDVSDVTKVPLDKLMTYNGIDTLSTWYVYEKYYPKMVQDQQEDLYKTFMLPTLKANIRCQLNGLPIDPQKVLALEQDLKDEEAQLLQQLQGYSDVTTAEYVIAAITTEKRNSKLKTKVTTVEDNLKPINFGSNKQLQVLLYDVMGLPVIETTSTKEPAVGKKVLQKLINHAQTQEHKDLLQCLCDLADVTKILTGFIPAFKNAYHSENTVNFDYLIGNFNLGGTVSGRLSSSEPNLQNLPATGSRFAKPVKKLFVSSDDWIYCGIDFNALEDRISALTTKDPNKLAVYLDGYDGHCLRALSYYGEQMPDIELAQPDEKCYICNYQGEELRFKSSDIINLNGTTYTGEQFYELVASQKL